MQPGQPPTVTPQVPAPPTPTGMLRRVLWAQAAVVAAGLAWFIVTYDPRAAGRTAFGAYAGWRSGITPTVVFSMLVCAGAALCARRLPRAQRGLYPAVMAIEIAVLADHVLRLFGGVFDLGLVIGVLLAVTALFYLTARDSRRYLRR